MGGRRQVVALAGSATTQALSPAAAAIPPSPTPPPPSRPSQPPPWQNIFERCGLQTQGYRYYLPATRGLDYEASATGSAAKCSAARRRVV